jgi:hypothetical protein
LPQASRLRVESQPLGVPVSVAPDLGEGPILPHEGVVLGHPAVVVESDDGSDMIRQGLGRGASQVIGVGAGAPVTDGDEEVTLVVKDQTRPEMAAPRTPGLGFEDLFHIL